MKKKRVKPEVEEKWKIARLLNLKNQNQHQILHIHSKNEANPSVNK